MNVAFIPVRGGSKSIPLKNIKLLNGKPLVYWAAKAADECAYIDKVYIATDSETIKQAVDTKEFSKVEVIGRSEESAIDTASTEYAMIEFAKKYNFDKIVLIQATSPLIESADLNNGFVHLIDKGYDSVLSVVRQKRFIWEMNGDNEFNPVNYDVYNRPRRQEFEGYLVENGAFYITSREKLLQSNSRISGKIGTVEMSEDSYFEIDELSDWLVVEEFMKKKSKEKKQRNKVSKIKMLLTDCDGCLTDGGMYYSDDGREMKKFNTKDGMGFQLLRERGIITGIITGEDNPVVQMRAKKIKADILKMGVQNKLEMIESICKEYQIGMHQIAYIGDDMNDLKVIEKVGFACSVQNAVPIIKEKAHYVSPLRGGDGAVRDIINRILEYFD